MTLISTLSLGNASAQIQNGLLSYWDFEDNFNDSAAAFSADSTTPDNGTGGSGVVFAIDGPLGTYGDFQRNALGTENLVVVPDSADLIATGESITISAWFRVDGFNQNWQALIAHGEDSDWRIARRSSEQGLGYAGGIGDIPGANLTPNVNDGEWHHVVAITEANVSTRLWIDGELIATSTSAPTITDNSSGFLYIGGNPQGNVGNGNVNQFRPWNGGIDDVAIWNRPLTSAEISQIFNSGQSGVALGALMNPEDMDNDQLPDSWEIANGLDPNDDGSTDINNGPFGNPDIDGLNNAEEFANSTDPQNNDSDEDFSLDGVEIINGTDPNNPDSDNDSLLDGHEDNTGIFLSATQTGTDPNVSDLDLDSDSDNLLNVWEISNGLNPFDDGTTDPINGAAGDPDQDQSPNIDEQSNLTDPQDNDSDDDFSLDGAEATNGTDPLNPDSDGDTLLDGYETNNGEGSFVSATDTGTNPLEQDSDSDGFNDNVEISVGTDPTDSSSAPIASTLPVFDDFEDNSLDLITWRTITDTVSQNRTGTILGGSVNETGGNIELGSRGHLITTEEFDPELTGGLQITGEITFLTTQDVVAICTRCNATPSIVFGEAESGVRFQISANGDTIVINSLNADHTVENLLVDGSIDFQANVVYAFEIIDDGIGNLSLRINERDTPENTISATATLSADSSDSNHVVFYNRENGRTSNIHQLAITTLTEPLQAEIQDITFDPNLGANGTFTLTWTSQLNTPYSIFASPDLIDWEIEVGDQINGQDGTTSATFANPSPELNKLFFRIEPPRP